MAFYGFYDPFDTPTHSDDEYEVDADNIHAIFQENIHISENEKKQQCEGCITCEYGSNCDNECKGCWICSYDDSCDKIFTDILKRKGMSEEDIKEAREDYYEAVHPGYKRIKLYQEVDKKINEKYWWSDTIFLECIKWFDDIYKPMIEKSVYKRNRELVLDLYELLKSTSFEIVDGKRHGVIKKDQANSLLGRQIKSNTPDNIGVQIIVTENDSNIMIEVFEDEYVEEIEISKKRKNMIEEMLQSQVTLSLYDAGLYKDVIGIINMFNSFI